MLCEPNALFIFVKTQIDVINSFGQKFIFKYFGFDDQHSFVWIVPYYAICAEG